MAELRELLSGRESVFAGPSGVGKSSLLNSISPGLGLRVGEISEKVRRGRHTTTSATMVAIGDGGFVVDTPGFSEVGVWGVSIDAFAEDVPGIRSPRWAVQVLRLLAPHGARLPGAGGCGGRGYPCLQA